MVATSPTDEQAGRAAASRVWHEGLKVRDLDERATREFADAAIAEFRRLQKQHTAGIMREILDGIESVAEQMGVEPYHGIFEVMQNADDLGATRLRVGFRKQGRKWQLLFCHDGDPVTLCQAVGMTIAFLSTKRDDARAKGKFGVGLKTLQVLGKRLEVHCPPYHFVIEGGKVDVTTPEAGITGFFDGAVGETLLVLSLDSTLDEEGLEGWLGRQGVGSLLFLDTLEQVELIDLKSMLPRLNLKLAHGPESSASVRLGGQRIELDITQLSEKRRGRASQWTRYKTTVADEHGRAHKAATTTTTLAVAVPATHLPGKVYVGLPTAVRLGLPFSINADFDPDPTRHTLMETPRNEWLFEKVSRLLTATALHRFATEPSDGWLAVGLKEEAVSDREDQDEWLPNQVSRIVSTQQALLTEHLRLPTGGRGARLEDLAYEAVALAGIVTAKDVADLLPGSVPLPGSLRDGSDRWREVLEDVGVSTELEVDAALSMLQWSDEVLGQRGGQWFVDIAAAAHEAGCDEGLFGSRSVLLDDGARTKPSRGGTDALLSGPQPPDSLGAQLGILRTLDGAYLGDSPAATTVREMLASEGAFVERPTAQRVMGALASWSGKPIRLGDEHLLELRNLLEQADEREAVQLAARIGERVTVRGRTFEAGKPVTIRLRPADAYLSPSIEKKARPQEAWGWVAGKVGGLNWIHPGYAKLITGGTGREQMGAARFFRMLGAQNLPRLIEPEDTVVKYGQRVYDIDRGPGNDLQLEAIEAARKHHSNAWVTNLKGDRVSPDLQAVAQDIASMRIGRERRGRARALLEMLQRAWVHGYEEYAQAQAVYGYYDWVSVGAVPATWLSRLASVEWLSSQGHPSQRLAPKDAKIRSALNIAVHGDRPDLWLAEISETDTQLSVAMAMGVEGGPRASTLLERLRDWRAETPARPDAETRTGVRRIYASLARYCTRSPGRGWTMVDDVAPAEVRRQFTANRLVFANGEWLAPRDVRRGRYPMFGPEQAFVPPGVKFDQLWDLLEIDSPSADECLDWLKHLVKTDKAGNQVSDSEGRTQLMEVYRHLFGSLADPAPKLSKRLKALPLLCADRWTTARPVYAVHDLKLARELANQGLSVWTPPCSLEGLDAPLSLLGVETLRPEDFRLEGVNAQDKVRGDAEAVRFAKAVHVLRDYLADTSPRLYRSLVLSDWRALESATIVIAPEMVLAADVGGRRVSVEGSSYIQLDPLMLVVAGDSELESSRQGGRQISLLFDVSDEDRLLIALAWESAWKRADEDSDNDRLALLEENTDWTDGDTDDATVPVPIPRVGGRKAKPSPPKKPVPAPPRVLIDPDSMTMEVAKPGAKAFQPGGVVRPKHVPLSDGPGKPIKRGGNRADSGKPKKSYGGDEREAVGMALLEQVVRARFGGELIDCTKVVAHGADGKDEVRYFELKAHAGPAPDEITLTRAEAQRALAQGGNYYLAVVEGVEEGARTTLTLIPDPLRFLDWRPKGDIKVGGYKTRDFPQWRFTRPAADADQSDTTP